MPDSKSVEVEVNSPSEADGNASVVISDREGKRCWSGEGKTTSEAATEAVRKLLGDRRIREYTSLSDPTLGDV